MNVSNASLDVASIVGMSENENTYTYLSSDGTLDVANIAGVSGIG